MRKFILIAGLVLASTIANGDRTRGLTLASNDQPAAAKQRKAVEAPKPVETSKPAEAPKYKYVERSVAVDTIAEAPKADQAKPSVDKNTEPLTVEKPKRKRESTEARVIYEPHRHGIYW